MPKLTQAALRSLIKKPGRHSDGGGLYFRVLNDAKAYFVYRYTVSGKERETSLGPYPELGLAEARDKHAELRKMVKVDRVDPIAQKSAAKTVQPSAAPAFGAMADELIAAHEPSWRNAKHAWQWKQTLGQYAAPLRDISVNEVATADVLAVLKPLWTRAPETGSQTPGPHRGGHRHGAGARPHRRRPGQPGKVEGAFGPPAAASQKARWQIKTDRRDAVMLAKLHRATLRRSEQRVLPGLYRVDLFQSSSSRSSSRLI